MPKHKTLAVVFFVITIFVLILVFYVPRAFCLTRADAESAIQSAESKLLDCYEAVYEAEKAGANVSSLLKILNEAGWLLSKAKLAYNSGDSDSAYGHALNCSQRLEGVVSQANNLKVEAEQASRMDFLINYVGSAVGSVAVIVGGYALWTFIKKREKP
ncbi:MAG: hypothetical protein QXZ68_07145 [Candidatus Bathyarchaeia archaeon]